MWKFFAKYPTAKDAAAAEHQDVVDIVSDLGLGKKRATALIRMSQDFISKKWQCDPKGSLYAVGKYAEDAYRIFCVGDWMNVHPQDHALNDYHDFLKKHFGISEKICTEST
jgi:methyl-CpG-binding domain protein 4